MICVSCGKTIDDDSRFCAECGARQPELNVPDALAEEDAPALSEAAAPAPEAEEKPAPKEPGPAAPYDPATAYGAPEKENAGSIMAASAPDYSSTQQPYGTQGGYSPADDDGFAPSDYNAQYGGIPYSPQPEPVPEPEPVPAEKAPSKVGAGKIILAGFVSVLAVAVLTLLSLALCVKLGVTGSLVRRRIEKMVPDNVLGADFDGESLSDNMYKGLGFDDITHGKVDRFAFRDFMTKTNFLSFVGDKAAGYVDCIIGGSEQDPSVSTSEIIGFFEENSDVSEECFGYSLQTADYNTMRKNIEKENFCEDISVSGLSNSAGFGLQNISFIFSYITLGILLALTLVLLIWIVVVVDRRAKHITGAYGAIFFWSGIIVLVCAAAVSAGAALIYVITGWFEYYVTASVLLPFAAFAGITGLFEIILGLVFRKVRKSIRAKERRDRAVQKALAEN